MAQKGQTVEVEDQGLPEYQKVKGEHAPNPGVDLALNKDKMMMATDCMWQVSFSTNIFLSSSKELLYLTLSVGISIEKNLDPFHGTSEADFQYAACFWPN